MDFHFTAEEWDALSPTERVHRCRLLAGEAQALADSASSPDLKKNYQRLADEWLQLAQEMEQSGLLLRREPNP